MIPDPLLESHTLPSTPLDAAVMRRHLHEADEVLGALFARAFSSPVVPDQAVRVTKPGALAKVLDTHRATGLRDVEVLREFAPDPARGLGGWTFSFTFDGLLPVALEAGPEPRPQGWIWVVRCPGGKFEERMLPKLAVGRWLLERFQISLWAIRAVVVDKEFRLPSSGALDGLLCWHGTKHYPLDTKVAEKLRTLLAQTDEAMEGRKGAAREAAAFSVLAEELRSTPPGPSTAPDEETLPDSIWSLAYEPHGDNPSPSDRLAGMGYRQLVQIPDEEAARLSPGHQLQISAARSRQLEWAPEGRARFEAWRPKDTDYPLHFFDLESYSPPLPLWPGTRCHQAVAFQFSAHTVETPGAEPVHREFLHTDLTDPRPAFVAALEACMPAGRGSLVVYTDHEKNTLTELLASLDGIDDDVHATLHRWLRWFLPRVVDPQTEHPTRAFDLYQVFNPDKKTFAPFLYHPAQRGSARLKVVTPALLGHNPWEGLAIQEGGAASEAYIEALIKSERGLPENAERDLKAYCAVDTAVMPQVLHSLESALPASPPAP